MRASGLALLSVVLAAACSVPSVDYTNRDGGGGGDDDGGDALRLVVTPTALTAIEGEPRTFSVALSRAPSAAIDVGIGVAAADEDRLAVAPATLRFDAATWATPQDVTVIGRPDVDTEAETVVVHVTSGVGDVDVTVSVTDRDVLHLVAIPGAGLDVTEGEVGGFAVRLSAPPAGPVTVAVLASDVSVALAAPAELHFGPEDWNADHDVVVTAQDDQDTVDDDGVVTLSAAGLDDLPVAIHVTEDDVLAIIPSANNLGTVGEGSTTTFTVKLSQDPVVDFDVALVTSDLAVARVTPATLRFRTTTWNTPQQVTVTLPIDDDVADGAATVTLRGPATGPAVMPRTITVAVDDPDVQAILATPTSLDLLEGSTRTLAVRLAHRPAADVTLEVTSLDGALVAATPGMLTFAAATFAQPQEVTVTALPDDDADHGATQVRLRALLEPLTRDVDVHVTDDEVLRIQPTTSAITLAEDGVATFDVRLSAQPTAAVHLDLSSADATAAVVTPAFIDIPVAGWATPHTITVTGVHDNDLAAEQVAIVLDSATLERAVVTASVTDIDRQTVLVTPLALSVNEGGSGTVSVRLGFVPDAATTVSLAASDQSAVLVTPGACSFTALTYATPCTVTIAGLEDPDAADEHVTVDAVVGAAMARVDVTVNDDDSLGIEPDATTLTIGEAGQATLHVRLTAQPAAAVTVAVETSDVGAATVSTAMLAFDAQSWATPQDVVIRGVDDLDPAPETVTVRLSAVGLTARAVTVTVTDDDPQGIVLSAAAATLAETGMATVDVRLAAQPPGDVTVNLTASDIGHATVSPASLTFNTASYATTQPITIRGVRDGDLVSDTVTIQATSTGLPTTTVTATVTDVDVQRVEALQTGPVALTEGGTATVSFRLAYVPSAAVSVAITSGHVGLGVSPSTLSFGVADFNTYKPVTLTGLQDVDAASITTAVTATPPAGMPAMVAVTVADDDPLTIQTTFAMTEIVEGGSVALGVRLTAQPPGPTSISVTSSDGGAAAPTLATLDYSLTDWSTYKYVTINGVHDVDIANEAVTITLASPPLAPRSISITVRDDDVLAIAPTVAALTVDENGTAGFGVALSHQPSGPVTVNLMSNDTGAAVVTGTVGFTTLDWATAKPVVVTGVADADADNEPVTLTLSSAVTADKTVAVTVIDDELILADLGPQMGPAAGGTVVTATGAGFTAATTVALGGRGLTGATVASPTQLTGTTQSGTRWVDAVASKGATTATLPRAFYHGAWQPVGGGLWGGSGNVVVPVGAATVYVGTEAGVYRSTDNGATWSPANAGSTIGTINDLAVDPQNPQRLYASGYDGLEVTSDGGATWGPAGTLTQRTLCVAVAPNSPTTIYACGRDGGVFRSLDGGESWTTVGAALAPVELAVAAQDPNTVLMASSTGVYKTTNGGATWSQVFATGGMVTVAFDPTTSAVAYAAGQTTFVRTADGGATWAAPGPSLNAWITDIEIHPTVTSTIYLATASNAFVSTTSGASWTHVSSGIPEGVNNPTSIALRRSNPSELYLGVPTWGVFRSTNAAASWGRSSTGLSSYSVTFVAPHPTTPGTAIAAIQYMELWRTTDHGATWTQLTTGYQLSHVVALAYMPGTPSTIFASANSKIWKSTDNGTTWNQLTSGLPANPGVMGFAMDPAVPATVLATSSTGVYRSLNGGATWSAANAGLPTSSIWVVAAGGVFYVSSYSGLFRSTDAGTTWTALTGAPAALSAAPRLVIDAGSGALYAQTSAETWRSTNGGAAWTRVATGTSNLTLDPTRSATAYTSGGYGGLAVKRTVNGFATQAPFADGITGLEVRSVAVDAGGATVYAGAYARGLWRVSP